MILLKTITFVSKFQLILKLDCFYCFSAENQCFDAQWVLRRRRQLDSV